jgi:hypothetical protein
MDDDDGRLTDAQSSEDVVHKTTKQTNDQIISLIYHLFINALMLFMQPPRLLANVVNNEVVVCLLSNN